MAQWLDTAFYSFDRAVFNAMHNLAICAGDFFTPLFKIITFLGKGGWAFILTAIILVLFKKTRKAGITTLFALACGAILTNIILKNLVGRIRPYLASEEYKVFWEFVSGTLESEYSFPSGHATASMATMTALFLSFNKKWSSFGFIFALLIGVTRIYLMVHYATDVIAGFIVGAIGGVCGHYLMKLAYKLCAKAKSKIE